MCATPNPRLATSLVRLTSNMRLEVARKSCRDWFFRLTHAVGIDRAVAYTVLARGWTAAAGAATVILIAQFLTRREQGYYYTFSSLVAMQIVFELGFSFVILQLAAHESAHLTIHRDGRVEGDPVAYGRYASILQKAVRWYSVAAVLMGLTLVGAGWKFFATHEGPGPAIHWRIPWICTVIASSLTFWMDPVFSFLDGSGKVSQVATLRFSQAMLGSILGWGALIGHHGLFSPAMIIFGQAGAGVWFLSRYRKLLLPLLRFKIGEHKISWGTEIWPFQWRMAATWASSYVTLQIFNPVLFAFRGPIEAGRMGMSLNIANAAGAIALSWMTTKAAPFGALAANRRFEELDRLFFRTLRQSTVILLAMDSLLIGALLIIEKFVPVFSGRILGMPVFSLIVLTAVFQHVGAGEASYLRAHKREPLVYYWIVIAALSAATTVLTGKYWGAAGITLGYFLLGGIVRFSIATLVFFAKRKQWHSAESTA